VASSNQQNHEGSDRSGTAKPWYRRKTVWLVTLFALYSFLGWVIVPIVLEQQLTRILKETAGWNTQVENIRFNPYALSLTVETLDIQSDAHKPVVDFASLYVNFEALQSLGGTITLAKIHLRQPRVYLDFDTDGVSNFQKAFASDSPQPEPEPDTNDGPLKLFFGKLTIESGKVQIADWSQGEEFNMALEPLGLELSNFATYNNEGGNYDLSISLGDAQQIDWQGQLGIAPFYSKGRLALSNINLATFWHYLEDYSPYWLNQARLSVAGDYETRLDETLSLSIEKGDIRLQDLALANDNQSENFLALPKLEVGPLAFDLADNALSLGTILLDELSMQVIRDKENRISLLKPLGVYDESVAQTPESEPVTTDGTPSDQDTQQRAVVAETDETENKPDSTENDNETPFSWNIDRLALNQATLQWQDQSLQDPADITISGIDLALKGLSDALQNMLPYALEFSINESRHRLAGELAPSPFAIKGDLAVNELPLDVVQAYLGDAANVRINDGSLTLASNYDIQIKDAVTGTLSSDLSIANLALSDTLTANPLAGFARLHLNPVAIDLDPLTVEIQQVDLVAPYGEILINEAGELNLAKLVRASNQSNDAEIEDTPDKNTPSGANTAQPEQAVSAIDDASPAISIGSINIEKGRVSYTDASLSPAFNSRLDELSGSLRALSSDPKQQSELNLKGQVDKVGTLSVNGTVNPLGSSSHSDIDIQIQNINLTNVSPYASRYMGYPIEKGKLNLDMAYAIKDMYLDASNHIIVDSLDLGSREDSPDALNIPLPLALGILKNTRGVIDIKLPVSGDLNDPGFSIGHILFTAFTNLLAKAVTSPFAILGSIIEGSEDLSSVTFEAGQRELGANEARKLQLLAEALQKRPNLNLEITGIASRQVDVPELKKQRLNEALRALGNDPLDTRENLINRWYENDEAGRIRAQQPAEKIGSDEHLKALDEALLEKLKLDDALMSELAKQRANLIAQAMTEQNGIAPERIFVLASKVVDKQEQASSGVDLPFSLNVR